MDWSLGTALLIVDWLIRLAALWWIPSRTTPAAARSWLLLVGFVPLLGLPLYLLLGHPWLSRERVARQARASDVIREEQRPLSALRWTPRDGAAAELQARRAFLVFEFGQAGLVHELGETAQRCGIGAEGGGVLCGHGAGGLHSSSGSTMRASASRPNR